MAHYALQPIRLVLELDAIHMLAESLLKANGHMETVSTGLLLDEPFATQIREAMELCADRSFVRVEDARPMSRSNTARRGNATAMRTAAGLPTIAGNHSPASSPRDDSTSDSMSDSDDGGEAARRRRQRVTVQPAKHEPPPRHYDALCRDYECVVSRCVCVPVPRLGCVCNSACCFCMYVAGPLSNRM